MKNKYYTSKKIKVDAAEEVMPFSDVEYDVAHGDTDGRSLEETLMGDPRFWSPTTTPEQGVVQEEEEQELQEEIDKKMQELLQSVKEGTIPSELEEYQKVLFDMHMRDHPEENVDQDKAAASFRKYFFDHIEEILSKGVTKFILKK